MRRGSRRTLGEIVGVALVDRAFGAHVGASVRPAGVDGPVEVDVASEFRYRNPILGPRVLVVGVTQGYTKKMEIFGVGYRVQAKGSDLEFALGYSHPVPIEAPAGITFAVESPTKFSVSGIDKQQVGEISAVIRRLRRPDPYKGKGIRYEGEQIRRKVGKTGK